eukprot:scaffold228_cov312-Pinguiococcus_pyrenoidosus.AAC.72
MPYAVASRLGCSRVSGVLQNLEAPLRPLAPDDATAFSKEDAKGGAGVQDDRGSQGEAIRAAQQAKRESKAPNDRLDDGDAPSKSASQAFSRLSDALAAAAKSDPEKTVAANVEKQDLRGNAAALLERIGWDECARLLKAESAEEQTLIMVRFYLDFMRREAWLCVQAELKDVACKPIASDRREMEIALQKRLPGRSSSLTLAPRAGQQGFAGAAQRSAADLEKAFFAGIILQRDQEIYQLRLKKVSVQQAPRD